MKLAIMCLCLVACGGDVTRELVDAAGADVAEPDAAPLADVAPDVDYCRPNIDFAIRFCQPHDAGACAIECAEGHMPDPTRCVPFDAGSVAFFCCECVP